MSILHSCAVALSALLLLYGSVSSWADVPTAHPAFVTSQDKSDADIKDLEREIEKFRTCATPLREAIAIVVKTYRRAAIADVTFDGGSAACIYRVKALYRGKIWDGAVDADRGEIADGSRLVSLEDFTEEDRSNLTALRRVGPDMSEAVMVAEKVSSGKAIGGGLGRDNGRLVFEITVLSDTELKKVILEPPSAARR